MKKKRLIIDIESMKAIVKEFEEMEKDKNKTDCSLSVGFENNLELRIIR